MKNSRSSRFVFLFLVCGMLFLLAACGSAQTGQDNPSPAPRNGSAQAAQSNPSPVPGSGNGSAQAGKGNPSPAPAHGNGSATSGGTTPAGGSSIPTHQVTTAPYPPTQTSCPSTGTARPAVMLPFTLGSDPNLVYIYNDGTQGLLKRYDLTNGQKQVIVTGPYIDNAQVSADGQWVLFTSAIQPHAGITALQLVRMDGQGLQTLYCTTGPINSVQWSPNQQFVAFSFLADRSTTVILLNINTGMLQTELSVASPLALGKWLDNTHLYLTSLLPEAPNTLYLLDTANGANQTSGLLTTILQAQSPFAFDSSFDANQLYIAGCRGPEQGSSIGPCSIAVQDPTHGPEYPVYISSSYAITEVQVVTPTTLLFLINNVSLPGQPADTSHNGWWKINTDGSGLTALAPSTTGQSFQLNSYTQYPWSNLSRDGNWYSFQNVTSSGVSLMFASISGGAPTVFASTASDNVAIAGWTTM